MMKDKIIAWKEYIETTENRVREATDKMTIAERYEIVIDLCRLWRSLHVVSESIKILEEHTRWDGFRAADIDTQIIKIKSSAKDLLGDIKCNC